VIKVLSGIADLIFPPRCLTCGVLLEMHGPLPFCLPCTEALSFIDSPLCLTCGAPFAGVETGDHLCGECLATDRPYAIARSVGRYQGTLLKAIHLFKYRGRTGIGKALGRVMADFACGIWDMKVFSLIMPVPLHRKRLKERGFNQAVILAREIADRFSLPLDFMTLRRNVYTEPQVALGREERKKNVSGAFGVTKPGKVSGRRILLVDDVFTTGSTLTECAAALMQAHAEAVVVLTLARAVHNQDGSEEDSGAK
jgi:ComF family protein